MYKEEFITRLLDQLERAAYSTAAWKVALASSILLGLENRNCYVWDNQMGIERKAGPDLTIHTCGRHIKRSYSK